MSEDLAVTRAVHGLESELLLLDFEGEHVLFVMCPMTRGLPQIGLVHVGGHDLSESSLAILALQKIHQSIVDTRTVGEEEGRTRRSFIEEEQLLILTNLSVIPLLSLSKEVLVLVKLLLVGERNTSNSLDGLVLAVTQPVSGRVPDDGESLDISSVRDVRSSAQIDEGAASIDGTLGAIGHSLVDEVFLVLAVLEHLEEFVLGHLQTLKRLLLLDDRARQLLQSLLVLLSNSLPSKC